MNGSGSRRSRGMKRGDNVKFQINYQPTWFSEPLFTPTSRVGQDVLRPGSTSMSKWFARVQLFF
jgi:hypothetical protein